MKTRVCHLPWDYENPYQKLLADGLEESGVEVSRGGRSTWIVRYFNLFRRSEIAHFHWLDAYYNRRGLPHSMVKAFCFVLQIRLLKLTGRKIFYTLHNLDSHSRPHPRLDQWVTKQVIGICDGVLAHCTYARRAAIQRYNLAAEKVHVVPHGHYIDSYPNQISKADAREKLDLIEDNDVLLFIGNLRRYKGVADLIEAVKEIDNDNLRLVIAGKFRQDADRDYILGAAKADPRIRICEGYVDGDEMQYFLNASDVVALPFNKILTSGSMILAMSFARPVIVPKVGCLAEAGKVGGAYYIEDGDQPIDALRSTIQEVFSDKQGAQAHGKAGYRQIEAWDWSTIGKRVRSIYASA